MVTDALSDFVTTFEELHRHLGKGDSSAVGDTRFRHLVDDLLVIDERLQSAAGSVFDAHDRQQCVEALARRALAQQHELIMLAQGMHEGEMRLAETVHASWEALAKADKSKASQRHVPVSTIVEYAERISHTNAAPVGAVAFEGACRLGWYHGWGAPAPQQHMLAQAQLACAQMASSSTNNQAVGGAAATSKAPPFSESTACLAVPTARERLDHWSGEGANRAHVSIELGSEEEVEEKDNT